MAKFSLVIECNSLNEALAYVRALAKGGYSSKLEPISETDCPASHEAIAAGSWCSKCGERKPF